MPQFNPCSAQVFGVHVVPQTFEMPPPPHSTGGQPGGHVPQLRTLPQPSATSPQFQPSPAQVFGVHPELEEALATELELAAVDDAVVDDALDLVVEVVPEFVVAAEPPELVPEDELTTTVVPHAATVRTTARPKASEA
jgi:hypothetical protein